MSERLKEPVLKTGECPQESVGQGLSDNTLNDTSLGGEDSVLAQRLAHLVEKYPDFAPVAEAWPGLPQAVRAGILAMVQASSP